MEKLKELLAKMASEFPGFVAAALVDKQEGLTILEEKLDENFEISITAAYSVELTRSQKRAIEALNIGDEEPIEIFSFTKSYIFISKPLADTPLSFHMALNRSKAPLGLVFAFLKRYEGTLTDLVREWQQA